MSVHALIAGTIFNPPEQRTSKAGRAFTVASMRVQAGTESEFWNVVAFSEAAQAEFARLRAGDRVAVQGTPKTGIYRDRAGEAKVSREIVADHVLALRSPPRERRSRHSPDAPDAPLPSNREGRDFDDDIPL